MAALKKYAGLKNLKLYRLLGCEYSIERNYSVSTDVVRDQFDNLAAHRRGQGGRASFSGVVATVFGANGFLGRYVVNRLGCEGTQVICPYRTDPYHMRDLKLAGELGQILFSPFDLKDEESIRKAVQYSNVVVNLIGRDWETKNFTFKDVHELGAERIARISKECGVPRFVHVSHLLASPKPPTFFLSQPSKFLTCKWAGEQRVRDIYPDATIIRPSDVFGPEDRFLKYYASAWRRAWGTKIPLWKLGEETVKRPIYYRDISEAIKKVIMDPSTAGNIYECTGPKAYQLSELVDYFYRCMRFEECTRTHVFPGFRLKVKLFENLPNYPILNADKLEREHMNDDLTGENTLEDLGMTNLTTIESKAKYELLPYQRHLHYEEKVGEFAEPYPPAALNI